MRTVWLPTLALLPAIAFTEWRFTLTTEHFAKRRPIRIALPVVCMLLVASMTEAQEARPGVDWPQFRGIGSSGIAEGFATPVRWDLDSGDNVRWQSQVPGLAHSSPVVWGDLVCVTTAVSDRGNDRLRVGLYGNIDPVNDDTARRWEVHCVDKRTGANRWTAVAHEGVPKIPRHPKGTHANPTLATDGTHLVAMFGSEGLYAYDLEDGTPLWSKDLGILESGFFQAPTALWGFASSPVIHDGFVIIQADVLNESFLTAFEVASGDEVWRTDRDDLPTWSTPGVHVAGDRAQVVVNGFRHIGGYDLRTGRELWRMRGGGDIPVPTPIAWNDLLFVTNSHGPASPIFAIRADASGDISLDADASSNEFITWSTGRGGAYMQTPLVYEGYLYNCRDNGVLSVYDARTGERMYQQRLGDGRTGFSGSPVAGDGKVYFSSEEGDIYVVRSGPEFELLAENTLNEISMATPALSEGVLIIRTRTQLIAIGADESGR
ncbi:MAG: PQQ-binding-like beta-propeller repeat protein [Vicinamibacterales bacterium]|jgi:outer membrane protein assembly factor BamB|nr:pyrrolo-quinoline quinone [Acidobacteriota bacterium]MDP6372109.1 PQQ-binding-like beta-propeller repeat protein [Vicinamibacterales bacterium]MDP6609253.1 PQQ-binding-like beta-propeller repeat protein [Vicinamibacterales bacterium]HAK57329.1 pyrrolo-quinoline quinone [Acidobacteriota bacterium]|tara:strand:+ start:5647 stop:7116 length:1470 start_codon:yes stop_codon:yes gene_type:complete